MTSVVHLGDCLHILQQLPDQSVDAVVTDPPYGLEFMGKEWDRLNPTVGNPNLKRRRGMEHGEPEKGNPWASERSSYGAPKKNPRCKHCARLRFGHPGSRCECDQPDWDTRTVEYAREMQAWHEAWAREALRVLKPGGHALVFGGTRTYHRLASGLEDAGFEIRDTLAWMYGSGFPKSLDVSKAIDNRAGATREVVGRKHDPRYQYERNHVVFTAERRGYDDGTTAGVGDAGDVTAPATDDARAWQGWGTALKPAYEPITLARKPLNGTVAANVLQHGTGALNVDGCRIEHANDADLAASLAKNPGRDDLVSSDVYGAGRPQQSVNTDGRWPANVTLDPEAAHTLDQQTGELDGASRFYYIAKTSRAERNAGLEGFRAQPRTMHIPGGPGRQAEGTGERIPAANVHPTVKPIAIMRWLTRLITPPGGTVLDPFTGSGTTGIACALEGFQFIGIEREPDYHTIATARIHWWTQHGEAALEEVRKQEQADAQREELAQMGQLDLFT